MVTRHQAVKESRIQNAVDKKIKRAYNKNVITTNRILNYCVERNESTCAESLQLQTRKAESEKQPQPLLLPAYSTVADSKCC